MITAIEIENFKGIRERTRIELKPVTMLFGPNSAGKSTLGHALQLAREIFVHKNYNPDRTEGGAGFIDLGGFQQFVHGHDLKQVVILRFDLDFGSTDFLTEFPIQEYLIEYADQLPRSRSSSDPALAPTMRDVSIIGDDIKTGWVEIVLEHSKVASKPDVSRYTVGFDGQPFARLANGEVTHLNVHHPLMRWQSGIQDSVGVLDALHPNVRPFMVVAPFLRSEPIEHEELASPAKGYLVRSAGINEVDTNWAYRITSRPDRPITPDEMPYEEIFAARRDGSCIRFWGVRCRTKHFSKAAADALLAGRERLHKEEADYVPKWDRFDRPSYEDDSYWASLYSGILKFGRGNSHAIPDLDRELFLELCLGA